VLKVLVVDDAAFMRQMLNDLLTEAGHDVVGEAADGREAVERYRELKPDLVTMDIVMPEMSGIDALDGPRRLPPAAVDVGRAAVAVEQGAQKRRHSVEDVLDAVQRIAAAP